MAVLRGVVHSLRGVGPIRGNNWGGLRLPVYSPNKPLQFPNLIVGFIGFRSTQLQETSNKRRVRPGIGHKTE